MTFQPNLRFLRFLPIATLTALLFTPAAGRAADAPKDAKANGDTTRALCDEHWEGGFSTIVVNQQKYDGTAKVKAYDPQHPEEAWEILSDSYLRYKTDYGVVWLRRAIGRFYDKKSADAFLRKVYSDSKFARYLNPRFPPNVEGPGALLPSDKYTCKLDRSNKAIDGADWIAEVDGHLFAGKESACKQEKKSKTVSIIDCGGKKVLATDTWSAPCDGSRIDVCLYPMSPGVVAVRQDYSASEEGRQTSFRVYDLAHGKQLAKFVGGGDWEAGGGSFTDFQDKDGDGIPEIVNTECESEAKCKEVRIRKWKQGRFVDIKSAH